MGFFKELAGAVIGVTTAVTGVHDVAASMHPCPPSDSQCQERHLEDQLATSYQKDVEADAKEHGGVRP